MKEDINVKKIEDEIIKHDKELGDKIAIETDKKSSKKKIHSIIPYKVLLIGGTGFLGKLLKEAFKRRYGYPKEYHFRCNAIGKKQIDLTQPNSNKKLFEIYNEDDYGLVVMMAANLGREAYLEEETAFQYDKENRAIFKNFQDFLEIAKEKGKMVKRVAFFSSSEVYGNGKKKENGDLEIFSESTNLNPLEPLKLYPGRHLYSNEKFEEELILKNMFEAGCFGSFGKYDSSSLMILRPFNISGPGQTRGVFIDMCKSALYSSMIFYSDDTWRTITPTRKIWQTGFQPYYLFGEYARQACDACIGLSGCFLSKDNLLHCNFDSEGHPLREVKIANIAEGITCSMKSLAKCISKAIYNYTGNSCSLIKDPQDPAINVRAGCMTNYCPDTINKLEDGKTCRELISLAEDTLFWIKKVDLH